MTRRQKREHILNAYASDVAAYHGGGTVMAVLKRKRAALDALAAIDAGKRWKDVLREFER